jgi:hypothetical protein
MKTILSVLITFAMVSSSWADSPREKAEDRLHAAASVLQEIMSTPDKGIPEEVIKDAKCIAPHEIRAGS